MDAKITKLVEKLTHVYSWNDLKKQIYNLYFVLEIALVINFRMNLNKRFIGISYSSEDLGPRGCKRIIMFICIVDGEF